MARISLADLVAAKAPLAANRGIVCFGWDGGRAEVATVALPAAEARGQRHTVYVLSDWLDTAGKLTTAQLVSLHDAGWEVGSHGKTNADLTGMSAAARLDEWDTAKTAIEAIIGAGECRHWSYPSGGANNTTTQAEGYLRFRTQRGFDANRQGTCLTPLGDRGYQSWLNAYTWASSNHSELLEWIRHVATTPVVLTVRAETCTDGASGPTPAQLTEALDLVESLGIPALTVDEVFGNPLWHPDPGFENGGAGWFKAGGGSFTTVTDTPDTNMPGTKSGKVGRTGAEATVYVKARTPLHAYGQTHTLSFRYRIVDRGGSGNITASARSIDFSAASQGNVSTSALTATTWTQATLDFTAHAAGRQLEVEFSIPGTRDADLYVDHVHVGPKAYGVYG